jgi:hypothetical protein
MKSFSRASNLKSCSFLHSEDKSFKCEICSKKRYQANGLTFHKLTHNMVKTFKCSQCEYSTQTSSDLTRHNRTHTKEKPYQCTICTKAFSTSAYLNSHKLTHIPHTIYGAGAVAWWQKSDFVEFFENAFYYCLALSDLFGNLKYAPTNSGRRVSYGIKKN